MHPLQRRPALVVALCATLLGACLLQIFPERAFALFAGGAARLASVFHSGPVLRVAEGWQIGPTDADRPVVVTRACAATDYFLLVVALLAWRFGRHPRAASLPGIGLAALAALLAAVPITLGVNALRIVAVVAAHGWVIPRLPGAFAAFVHLLVGVAVFLPALLVLNLVLATHERRRLADHPA